MGDKEKKKFRWIQKVLLLALIISLGKTMPVLASPFSENGQLAIKNGRVVNNSGQTFVIKGVSTHGLSFTENGVPFKNYVNSAAFKELRDNWGVNTIRMAMYTSEYNGYCVGDEANRTALKQVIKNGVKYASDLGMYCIIDWHILNDGSGNPLTQKDQAVAFFSEISGWVAASGYKNVLYEICNEPNSDGSSENSWSHIKSYANAVIPAIRTNDKSSIIIVGTPTWSQDVERPLADPITDYSNIAYSFHFYAGTHKEDMRSRLENALKNNLPVIVTEFGICDASGNGSLDTDQANAWMKLLDQYGVGRTAWSLCCKNESASLLKSSCTKTSGFSDSDLSQAGAWLKGTYTGKTVSYSAESSSGTQSGTSSSDNSSAAGSNSQVSTGSQLKTKTSKGKVKIRAQVYLESSWTDGSYTYSLYRAKLKNTGKKKSKKWTLTCKFSEKVTFRAKDGKWCASFKKSGKKITIKPLSWNKKLRKGDSTEIGFILMSQGAQKLKSISISAS